MEEAYYGQMISKESGLKSVALSPVLNHVCEID